MSNYIDKLKKHWLFVMLVIFYLFVTAFIIINHVRPGLFSLSGTDYDNNKTVTTTVVGQIPFADSSSDSVSQAPSDDYSDDLSDEDYNYIITDPAIAEILGVEPAPQDSEVHYYRFRTVTKIQRLHVRTGPGLTYSVIDKLPKGTTGTIITRGENWSYLRTDSDVTGYCYNGYLEFTEIDPSEYPEELKEITPPIEP